MLLELLGDEGDDELPDVLPLDVLLLPGDELLGVLDDGVLVDGVLVDGVLVDGVLGVNGVLGVVGVDGVVGGDCVGQVALASITDPSGHVFIVGAVGPIFGSEHDADANAEEHGLTLGCEAGCAGIFPANCTTLGLGKQCLPWSYLLHDTQSVPLQGGPVSGSFSPGVPQSTPILHLKFFAVGLKSGSPHVSKCSQLVYGVDAASPCSHPSLYPA